MICRLPFVFVLLLGTGSAFGGSPRETAERFDRLLMQSEKLVASDIPAATDATLLRRVWMDLCGRVPPTVDVSTFTADKDPKKYQTLVSALLVRDEFAEHWSGLLAEQLLQQRPQRSELYDGPMLRRFLQDSLKSGKPWNTIGSELIQARGVYNANGAVNYLLRYQADPDQLAGAVGQTLMGITLKCAQCHDHPFAKWKQKQFRETAAVFARTRRFEYVNEQNEEYLVAVLDSGTGEYRLKAAASSKSNKKNALRKVVLPRLLNGTPIASGKDRRQQFAEWVTAARNPYFARHAVNTVWKQLFGVGLVKSFDEIGANGSRQKLLDLLTDDFVANGYNLRRLLGVIVSSQAYRSRCRPAGVKGGPVPRYARYVLRPLSPDQVYRSILAVTQFDPADHYFDDADEIPPDLPLLALGAHAPSVQRSLVLQNGEYAQDSIRAGARRVRKLLGRKPGTVHIQWMFRATLSRNPTDEESRAMSRLLEEHPGLDGLEDLLWVLFNSVEFNTAH